MPSGHLVEVFSGIQGEGPIVGYRQIFVRLAGCNLSCPYCDTPAARDRTPFFLAETEPGGRFFEKLPNPADPERLAALIARLDPDLHHSVSLTGGEPLLQADYIAGLAPKIRNLGLKVYLETNGTLPDELHKVVSHIDLIGMDWKIGSVAGPGALAGCFQSFLEIAATKKFFCKVVVGPRTVVEEVCEAARAVAKVVPGGCFILQPVTPAPGEESISPDFLLGLQAAALKILKGVRVIPQTHKMLGQM